MKLVVIALLIAVTFAVKLEDSHLGVDSIPAQQVHQAAVEEHDVIVIGAGVSGLKASQVLDDQEVEHIVIEATDHIGGRVVSYDFEGVTVNKGASFIHNATKGNPVADFVKKVGNIRTINATADYDTIFDQRHRTGPIPLDQARSARNMFAEIVKKIMKRYKYPAKDVSVDQAYRKILTEDYSKEWPCKLNLVKWFFTNLEYVDGTKLIDLSAQNVVYHETKNDLMPVDGFHSVVEALFKNAKKNVRFNEKVTEIDTSGERVKVTTNKKVYSAKKVLGSFPMGILKHNKVKFTPSLPNYYQNSIRRMGWSVADKVYVIFDKPFWKQNTRWLSFVTKVKSENRYPAALVYPTDKYHMLAFYTSDAQSRAISNWSDDDLIADISAYLDKFGSIGKPKVLKVYDTHWHADPNTLGSFSFYKVGNTEDDFLAMQYPIDNKFWFIGEHTRPELNYYVQGAYLSGKKGAEQAVYCLRNECEEGEFEE